MESDNVEHGKEARDGRPRATDLSLPPQEVREAKQISEGKSQIQAIQDCSN